MKRRERFVAAALLLTVVASGCFIASYATGGGRLFEGLSLAGAAVGLSLAALGWAFWLIPDERVVDELDAFSPVPIDVRMSRPRWLLATLAAALGSFGLALIVPIRSLGPRPGDTLFHTKWRKGDALVRPDGTPVRVDDLNVDSDTIVFPQGSVGDAMSQVTLVRVGQSEAAQTQGYLAYSRVCTHAGCPVALYRASVKQLMCPCHQSVFDVMNGGAVLSGPADHALPRLPIEVDREGVLRASGDFPEPVGPGFWERG